jgi:hypothetical protein
MGALEYWTESHGPMAGYMECILVLAQKEVLLPAGIRDGRGRVTAISSDQAQSGHMALLAL